MPQYLKTEETIRDIFAPLTRIEFEGEKYTIVESGKPRPTSAGECKTDVYIKLKSDTAATTREVKISIKQSNADFLENKMQYDRAKEIFGNEVDKILTDSINSIKDKFLNKTLIAFDKKGNTQAKSITLGWRYEILNKKNGYLSGKLPTSYDQALEIYSGQKLPDSKRNANVNGIRVKDSGVANYILVVEKNCKYDLIKCINSLIPLKEYVTRHPDIFFVCKAVNYRVNEDKWEGDRPLSVYVDWKLDNGEVTGQLIFDTPLQKKANLIGNNVKTILGDLNISEKNFQALETKLANGVKYYKAKN